MFRHATIALTCFWILIAASPGVAQSVQPANEQSEELSGMDRLLKKKYSSRQQATLEMWRQRERNREEVQEAARHPDPEVSGRAKWILRQWQRGSLPDTPPEVSRLLQRLDGPAAITRLLEGGHFRAAVVAIEESAGMVDRQAIQDRINHSLSRRFPIYIHHAVTDDSLADLLKIVDMVAESKEVAACRLQLMHEMGIEIDQKNLLPSSASGWPKIQVEQTTALLLVMMSRFEEAIQLAKTSTDPDLLHQCRMIAGKWSEAAEENAKQARLAEAGSFDHAHRWCLTLIAAERAGNRELSEEAVAVLSSPDLQGDDLAAELRWKCLASHGKVEQAFLILDKLSPHASASVAIDSSRTERSFAVLGYPLERLDQDLTKWVNEALEAQAAYPIDELCEETRNLLALMQCLISVGYDLTAHDIAKRLSESEVKVGKLLLREYVLSTLTMTQRSDWLVQLAVNDVEKILSPTSPHTIARTLADADGATLEIMMDALVRIMSGKSLKQRLVAADQLLRGEIPEGFDPEVGFQHIFEHITTPRISRDLRRRTVQLKEILATEDFVTFFSKHGEAELAQSTRRKMAESGDINALFALADQQLDRGRTAMTQTLLDEVYERIEDQVLSSGRYSGAADISLAVKSMIGSWKVARRLGDQQRSEQLEREIRLCLCAPSPRMRKTVAEYLVDRDESELAMEAYEALLPMTVFGTQDRTSLYDVARSYSLLARKTKVAEAARWFDLAVGGTLDSMNYRPGAYITLPLYVQRWSIEAALEANDPYLAKQSIERLMALDPMDIDFAERLLPKMREAGMDDLADEALDQIVAAGVEYVRRFPFDSMTSNNLAWVAAMNERHLDDAIWLSRSAVFSEPDSAIYRDTLAEVLFLRGEIKQAWQVEKACLLDDPTQWHLHEQVKKYEAALK